MSERRLRFEARWVNDIPELTDEGLRATFAEFTLTCDQSVLTRHVNGSSVFASVFVPVAPIARWIAGCWADLIGESAPFVATGRTDVHRVLASMDEDTWEREESALDTWLRAHALHFVGDGLLLPDVIFFRVGDTMSVSWRGFRASEEVEFLGAGHAEIPLREFVDAARELIRATLERMAQVPAHSASATELRQAAERVQEPWSPRGLRVVAGRVGRSVESLRTWLGSAAENATDARDRIVKAYGIASEDAYDPVFMDSPVARAARSAGPRLTEKDHARLIVLGEQLQKAPEAEGLRRLRGRLNHEPTLGPPRAKDGQRRAGAVRAALRWRRRKLDVEGILCNAQCEIARLALDDRMTDGIALWTHEERALIVANTSSPRTQTVWGLRAMLAHELYHLLYDAHDARFFAEATSDMTPTPSEPAANAFAAELLLPAQYLPRDVGRFGEKVTADAVKKLCDEFGVGWELAVRQLQNRRRLPRPAVDALLDLVKKP